MKIYILGVITALLLSGCATIAAGPYPDNYKTDVSTSSVEIRNKEFLEEWLARHKI